MITYSDATMSKLSANSYAVEIAWNLEHSNCVAIGHACGRIVVKKIGKSEKIYGFLDIKKAVKDNRSFI